MSNNRGLLWAVKITAALFQIPATGRVVFNHFSSLGVSPFETYFSTFLAVILIDVLLLYVLAVLEAQDIAPIDKLPWAVGGLFLMVATVVIGYIDEGWFAWMPRIGFIMLVTIALFSFVAEYTATYRSFEARTEREKRKRDLTDLIYRNQAVKKRQNMRKTALEQALQELQPYYIEKAIQKELGALGMDRDLQPEQPTLIKQQLVLDELPEGILQLESGAYAWERPATGELVTETTQGKDYTLRGAKLALSRELKKEQAW